MKIFKIMAFVILACSSQAILADGFRAMKFTITYDNKQQPTAATTTYEYQGLKTNTLTGGSLSLSSGTQSVTITCGSSKLQMSASDIAKVNQMFVNMAGDFSYKPTGKGGTFQIDTKTKRFHLVGYGTIDGTLEEVK
jgi:hypothetical protein